MIVRVIIPIALDQYFDYNVPDSIEEGVRVGEIILVPFRNSKHYALVSDIILATEYKASYKLKDVIKSYRIILQNEVQDFIKFVAKYTMSSQGMVLKMVVEEGGLKKSQKLALFIDVSDQGFYQNLLKNTKLTPKRQIVIKNIVEENNHGLITTQELSKKSNVSLEIIKTMIKIGLCKTFEKSWISTLNINNKEKQYDNIVKSTLNEEQEVAFDDLKQKLYSNQFSATLLDGVTGSGKTEVYFALIQEVLENNLGQVMILMPEIILTYEINQRFYNKFGFYATVWNSEVSVAQKSDIWLGVLSGDVRVIIGARSSLFLPFKELKLILIDEEHDHSFKQEDNIIYQGRDMAVMRAKLNHIPILLGSATPSIETVANVESGKYSSIKLSSRFGFSSLPQVEIIDMKYEKLSNEKWISMKLLDEIKEQVANGKQALLFLNRRGYAPLVLCQECEEKLSCVNCSSWLVEHRGRSYFLMCHYCGYKLMGNDIKCLKCGDHKSLRSCGPGVERIAEEVKSYFPELNIITMTSDNAGDHQNSKLLIEQIKTGHYNIIIGTQIIAKGHHFPLLELIGVIDADLASKGGDLRNSEKTYQLLHQVSGRAGRESKSGRVLLQSYFPNDIVIQSLVNNQRDEFLANEIAGRKVANMPPFGNMAAIIINGFKEEEVEATARNIARNIPRIKEVQFFGPAKAPIYMMHNRYRYRFLVIAPKKLSIQKIIEEMLKGDFVVGQTRYKIDINPYSFM